MAIGDFESNLLLVVALKHLGVRNVVAKALTHRQAEILLKIGADEVVLPEQEAGERLAARLIAPELSQILKETTGVTAGERAVPEQWIGKTLGQIQVRRQHGVLVIAVRRSADLIVAPGSDARLEVGDQLIFAGPIERLHDLGCRNFPRA